MRGREGTCVPNPESMKQTNREHPETPEARGRHGGHGGRRRLLALLAAAAVLPLAACGTLDDGPVPDGYYRVQSGDTLYSIARKHRRSVRELARWNSLSDADRIEVGQVIRVVPAAGAAASAGGGRASGGSGGPAAVKDTPRVDDSGPARPPASRIRLQWPADGKVVARYAPPASKGLRIDVPAGGVVRAAAAGRAIHVGNLRGYGMLVIVKHDDDWLTVYGNLDKPSVSEDSQVAAGQEVGRMGAGGGELHFEVRAGGKPVDPSGYLPSRG